MTRLATEGTREGVRLGTFRYMQTSAESSLYRNGKVLSRRDRDGSDSGLLGVDLEDREMAILDARTVTQAEQPTLSANGFELVERPSADPDLDFLDHDVVARAYYPECAEIVRAATGAATVAAFDHNVRSATGKSGKRRIAGGQQVQGPAHLVHGDYTLTSAPQRMRDLARPPTLNDTYRTVLAEDETLLDAAAVEQAITDGRFALINLWRNIAREPVATRPLALCDGMSVHPEELVVFEIHYSDRIGENYFAKHDDRHRWVYWSAMTRDEALLIKQWIQPASWPGPKGRGPTPTASTNLAPSASIVRLRILRPRWMRPTAGASRFAARCFTRRRRGGSTCYCLLERLLLLPRSKTSRFGLAPSEAFSPPYLLRLGQYVCMELPGFRRISFSSQ